MTPEEKSDVAITYLCRWVGLALLIGSGAFVFSIIGMAWAILR